MSWIACSLIAAFFLGCYELCTKHAVRENAVLPVLFLSTVCGALVWGTLLLVQAVSPTALPAGLIVPSITWVQHLQLLLKSLIVASSWVCTYFALKHLPLSIASPIRATGPVWTVVGAMAVLVERPSWMEFLGSRRRWPPSFASRWRGARRASVSTATAGSGSWSRARCSAR